MLWKCFKEYIMHSFVTPVVQNYTVNSKSTNTYCNECEDEKVQVLVNVK